MLTLTSVSPIIASNRLTALVLTLVGTGVTGAEVVALKDGTNPDIIATSVTMIDAQTLQATVNVSGAPVGYRTTWADALSLPNSVLITGAPRRERIVENLKATLEGITNAAGYAHSVRKVLRAQVPGVDIVEYPTIILAEPDEIDKIEPLHKYHEVLRVVLECWLALRSEVAIEANLMLAEVKHALMVDPTRGGLAIETRFTSNRLFVTDTNEPIGGVEIELEIWYRHNVRNPFLDS